MSDPAGPMPLPDRLRRALSAAMKERNDAAVRALRSALARLDNAQAVDAPATLGTGLAVEHIPRGVGAGEVPRRPLTDDAARELVRAEVDERRHHAAQYDAAGEVAAAEQLRAEADALEAVIDG